MATAVQRGTLAELRKALAGERWPAVVVLGGDDAEARDRALAAIVGAIPEEDRATAVERFSGAPVPRIFDAARTAPLLGGRRVIVVTNVDWLVPGGDEKGQEELTSFVAKGAGDNVLVLVAPKLDRRLGVVKALEKQAFVLDCPLPREREMPQWLADRGRERGLALDPRAAQLLADAIGTDTGLAARELDKIALLAHPAEGEPPKGGVPVGAPLVEQALGPSRAAGAFQLEDALLAGDGGAALEALERHLAGSTEMAIPLLGRMAAVVRRLALSAGVVGRGGGEQDVQQALGAHPFVAQKYAQAARRVGPRAERALAACVAADGMLKSGRDPRAALTRIVLALSTR